MSLCIRTISNKFAPFANSRKPVAHIDRQLPKSSTFLEEFLGVKRANYEDCKESNIGSINTSCTLQHRSFTNFSYLSKISSSKHKLFADQDTLLHSQLKYSEYETHKMNISNNSLMYKTNDNLACNTIDNRQYKLESINFVKSEKPILNESDKYQNLPEDNAKPFGKPSEQQLENVYQVLCEDLPHLFVKPVNYEIYHNDIIFINNIKGTVSKGVVHYIKQVVWLKLVGHVRFAHVKNEVIKITKHPEEGTIKVRWRIRSISGAKVLFSFWKLNLFKMKQHVKEFETWYDGFSTYYVGRDGKVYKHIADKMMPDENTVIDSKPSIAPKLALFSAFANFDEFRLQNLFSKLRFLYSDFRIKN